MKMRMKKGSDGRPMMVGLLKGEKLCSCGSVTRDGLKVRGDGCVICDPDKSVDPVSESDSVDDQFVKDEASVVFIHETVDPVADEDIYKVLRVPHQVFQRADRAL